MFDASGLWTAAGLVFLAYLLLRLYLSSRKPPNYPPGPKWWPVVGSAFEVAKLRRQTGFFSEACNLLEKTYGPVIGLKIGTDRIVILNDFESMKSMIMNEACDGRPIGPVYDSRTFGKRQGVLVTDGPLWVEQRRFILRHLRDLGFGKTDMTVFIEDEAAKLVEYYKQVISRKCQQIASSQKAKQSESKDRRNINGQIYQLASDTNANEEKEVKKFVSIDDFYLKIGPELEMKKISKPEESIVVEMADFFGVPVLNTLWRMMAGKRYNVDDQELISLQKTLTTLLRDVDMFGCLFNQFPILRYLAPELSGYKKFMDTHRQLWKFLKDELENHKKLFDPTAPRDLMDVYLQVLQSPESPGEFFTEEQLLAICVDLFMAGSETSAKALTFGFLYLVLYPEVQKKAQREIDLVVGRERLPSLNDRPRMTYVSAIVLESVRMFMGRTLNIPHRAMKDTQILGYTIPKDSMIVVNFNRILMNEHWGDPEVFRPERFIDQMGKIILPEQYLPFSFGKHRCLGEVLAKSNMFVITAALLQSFTFSAVPGEEKPRDDYIDGVTASPKPFRVLLTKRV